MLVPRATPSRLMDWPKPAEAPEDGWDYDGGHLAGLGCGVDGAERAGPTSEHEDGVEHEDITFATA